MWLEAGTSVGRYRIVDLLGAGGMGEVYRARDVSLDREVALKILIEKTSPGSVEIKRFEQEARAGSALHHPRIVSIFDFGTHDGMPYLVCELVRGQTLSELIKRSRLQGLAATNAKQYSFFVGN
jgi:eukaryotic-like serine/threonine-protein kinase